MSVTRSRGLYAMALIVGMAFFLRVADLERYPPGLSRDEAVNVLDAFKVADGVGFPLYEDANRPEPLYRWMLGAGALFFGHTVWAMRFVSALLGTLTVAVAYRAVAEALNGQSESMRQLAAMGGAAALAAAMGHVTLSRALYRGIAQPLFTLLAIVLLLRAIRTRRVGLFPAAGVSLALAIYSYTAALALPVLLLSVGAWLLLFQWLPAWNRRRRAWFGAPNLKGFALLILAFLLLVGPIGWLLVINPEAVLGRAAEVSAGSQDPMHLTAANLLPRLLRTWRMWAAAGDANPQYNTASAPLLPPGTYPVFLLGLAMCLRWVRRPASWLLPPLVAAALVPVTLSDEIPHGLRAVGAFSALPLLVGYGAGGLMAAASWLAGRWPAAAPPAAARRHAATVAWLLVLASALFLVTGSRTTYVRYWSRCDVTWEVFGQEMTSGEWFFLASLRDFASWVDRQANPVYIPASVASTPTLRAYLAQEHPQTTAGARDMLLPTGIAAAPYRIESQDWDRTDRQYVLVRDGSVTVLPPLDSESHSRLVTLLDGGHDIPRPDGTSSGRFAALSDPLSLSFEGIRRPDTGSVAFENGLSLVGWGSAEEAASVARIAPSQPAELTLYWEKVPSHRSEHEYLTFIQVWTQTGIGVAGIDTELARWLYPPTAWQEGETFPQVVRLGIPPDLPPGAYRLVVGLYAPFGDPVQASAPDHNPLGTTPLVGWLKVPQQRVPGMTQAAERLDVILGTDLALRGKSVTTEDDCIRLRLYWEALRVPQVDATIFVHAVGADGQIVAQHDSRPWEGQYPTFIWDAAEIVVTEHVLPVPASQRPITLYAGAYTLPGPENLPAVQCGVTLPDGRAVVGELLP